MLKKMILPLWGLLVLHVCNNNLHSDDDFLNNKDLRIAYVVSNAVNLSSDAKIWIYVPEDRTMFEILNDETCVIYNFKSLSLEKFDSEVTLKNGEILKGLLYVGYDDTRIGRVIITPYPNTIILTDTLGIKTLVPLKQVLEIKFVSKHNAVLLTVTNMKYKGKISLPENVKHFILLDDIGWKELSLDDIKKIVLYHFE